MTELQEQLAITALDLMAGSNGVCTKNDVLKEMRIKHGESNLVRVTRDIVLDKQTNEFALVRQNGNIISLTENGELAQKMGFSRYLKKMHKNERLDIKLKHMDFWLKVIDLLDKSKMLIIVVAVLLYIVISLCVALFYRLSPTLSGAVLLILGMALGALLTQILSVRRRKRRQGV